MRERGPVLCLTTCQIRICWVNLLTILYFTFRSQKCHHNISGPLCSSRTSPLPGMRWCLLSPSLSPVWTWAGFWLLQSRKHGQKNTTWLCGFHSTTRKGFPWLTLFLLGCLPLESSHYADRKPRLAHFERSNKEDFRERNPGLWPVVSINSQTWND